jgi:hypothetical protein
MDGDILGVGGVVIDQTNLSCVLDLSPRTEAKQASNHATCQQRSAGKWVRFGCAGLVSYKEMWAFSLIASFES